MADQMHLMQMLIHSVSTHTLLSWTDPADKQLDGLQNFAYWQDLARTAERGCFDAVFFADSPATHQVYKSSPAPSLQYGVAWPNHDPMPLIAVMAAATERLGFAVTLSTTGTTPYLATRRMSTLDYLSKGRVGWNIVTGFGVAEHWTRTARPGHSGMTSATTTPTSSCKSAIGCGTACRATP